MTNAKMRAFLGMKDAMLKGKITLPLAGSLTNPPRPDDDEPKATDVTISSRTVEAMEGLVTALGAEEEPVTVRAVTPETMAERETNSPVATSLNPDNTEKTPAKKAKPKRSKKDKPSDGPPSTILP